MKVGQQPFRPRPWIPLARRARVPSGVPPRRLAPDALGPGACSFRMMLRDDGSGRGVDLEAECSLIVIAESGRLLIDCGNRALVLGPGHAAGLLPCLHSCTPVGAMGEGAVVTVAALPDRTVGRLLDDGGLWQLFLNLAAKGLAPGSMEMICPLPGAAGLPPGSFAPGRLCEGLLRRVGGHPYDEGFHRFLAMGPLRGRVGEPGGEPPPSFVIHNPRDICSPGDNPARKTGS